MGEMADGSSAETPPTLVTGMIEIVGGFVSASLEAGKQLLESFTPGITLFKDEDTGQDTALTNALQQAFTPLSAIAFLVFVLLYVPCLATVGAQVQEFGWSWAALSVAIMLVVPWVLAVTIYQGGTLLGFG